MSRARAPVAGRAARHARPAAIAQPSIDYRGGALLGLALGLFLAVLSNSCSAIAKPGPDRGMQPRFSGLSPNFQMKTKRKSWRDFKWRRRKLDNAIEPVGSGSGPIENGNFAVTRRLLSPAQVEAVALGFRNAKSAFDYGFDALDARSRRST